MWCTQTSFLKDAWDWYGHSGSICYWTVFCSKNRLSSVAEKKCDNFLHGIWACIYSRMISGSAHTWKICVYLDPSVKEEPLKVKSMQSPGTEAIRTQIQPSNQQARNKQNYKINNQNTKRTYGQPRGQLFPKRWPFSNPNQTKKDMNTHKVKHHRSYYTKKKGNREPQQN